MSPKRSAKAAAAEAREKRTEIVDRPTAIAASCTAPAVYAIVWLGERLVWSSDSNETLRRSCPNWLLFNTELRRRRTWHARRRSADGEPDGIAGGGGDRVTSVGRVERPSRFVEEQNVGISDERSGDG